MTEIKSATFSIGLAEKSFEEHNDSWSQIQTKQSNFIIFRKRFFVFFKILIEFDFPRHIRKQTKGVGVDVSPWK